ncbi:histone deacetylase [Bremerella sp. JC817]|uniref:histone deacetylase family protein n=1 Tax=Bremerella sp. JC817 TaxID=3231756 RepID=UPI0034576F7F
MGEKNLLYYDDRFLQHKTTSHPESAVRLMTCTERLQAEKTWESWVCPPFEPATKSDLLLAHDASVAEVVEKFCQQGGGRIEVDTLVSPESYQVALLAVGAAIDATQKVVRGEADNAFCLFRPPGHHATPDTSMGFCLFNNVAVAASYAVKRLDLSRVLVVDWDVHHGNGTQDIFWRDETVGFFSMHRYPFYPGSGDRHATGEGPGLGLTHNLPVTYGTERAEILSRFEHQLQKFAERVRPELVLISAGFDAHKDDPVGDLGLESEDYITLTQQVQEVANTWCGGRIVSLLEGGYNPTRLAESVQLHLNQLAGDSSA